MAGKEINRDRYLGKLDGTTWLTVLPSPNSKIDGNRLWLRGRLGLEGSFDIWLDMNSTQSEICACVDE